ncbi:hypothetical protein BKA63DRAFT_581897 [Paraphoma chrysanthemicola]|nr:hypothetical protein BKA63DRAFT_581897 [Paraphoma chrysanthemicola]
MTHQHHHENMTLNFFASPLQEENGTLHDHIHTQQNPQLSSDAFEDLKKDLFGNEAAHPLNITDEILHDLPAFRRHAESTNAELFFDLCDLSEINDAVTLTAYVGFFAVLWLTWCNVSLFDVRFIADSVSERIAKAFHFGVMVGFAVVGLSWQPGKGYNFNAYRALSMILMGSRTRTVLALRYSATLYFTRKHRRTIVPISLMIALTLLAAVMYGALLAGFTHPGCTRSDWIAGSCVPPNSDVYIAWYVIGISELVATIVISSHWRVISFKGTHIEQRMSLLTLIVLGEGIMVIFFNGSLIGQIVASVLIIYFLYMLYFDRIQNEHFGTIRQQAWSSLHFPLHVSLVLLLQGVSLLIDWVVAVQGLEAADQLFQRVEDMRLSNLFVNGTKYCNELRQDIDEQVWTRIPKSVDASKALDVWNKTLVALGPVHDYLRADPANNTALNDIKNLLSTAETISIQAIFDSLSISIPKDDKANKSLKFDKTDLLHKYEKRLVLVFDYVYISAGIALMLMAAIGIISLPARRRQKSEYIRLAVNGICGLVLCLITLVHTSAVTQERYLESAWMLPVICIITFIDVLALHIRKSDKHKGHQHTN